MRASRFPLHLPVRYRRIGDPQWHEGRTENISRSGVLFRAEDLMQVDTSIEIRLALAVTAPGSESPEIACRGRVVRTISPSDNQPLPGSAIVIDNYDFVHPPADAESLSSSGP
jgi:hypothetical protein